MSYTLIDNDTGKDIVETLNNQKEEIESIGYKEFYRYYIEKHKLAKQLSKQLQQKENIIKEVRKYVEENIRYLKHLDEIGAMCSTQEQTFNEKLLEILDKVDNDEKIN